VKRLLLLLLGAAWVAVVVFAVGLVACAEKATKPVVVEEPDCPHPPHNDCRCEDG